MTRVGSRHHDASLMEAIAAGDAGALATLYDLHAAPMLATARSLLSSPADAEDLVHDVFVEAWQKARDFDARRGSARSWLLARVRSRSIDRWRSLQVARRHAMAKQREPAGPAPAPWSSPDRTKAREAIGALPEPQRELVRLSYFEGLSYAEMADRCGIPIGTVRSRLSAALGKLRRHFHSEARPQP